MDPATCLHTALAADVVRYLDLCACDEELDGSFMNTIQFQVQYYDMPRKPGTRIERPDILGRKCWANAYMGQRFDSAVFTQRLHAAGLSAPKYTASHVAAVTQTWRLCEEVMANCFVNASYDPRRNGTCPEAVSSFRLFGFEFENALRNFPIQDPFY